MEEVSESRDVKPDKLYKKWHARLEKEKKAHKKFREQAEKAEQASRDDGDMHHEFNIQWANCKIVRSAIYASRPKPDVRRRYQKPDPEEKELARLVERAIEYQIDVGPFDACSQAVVKDYVESGLGTPRVYLDVVTQPVTDELGQEVIGEDGEPVEEIISESVGVEHVPWRHFHWEPGKSWENVDWVAFQSFHPRKELEEKYDVEIKAGTDDEKHKRDAEEYADEVQVFEIWCKSTGSVYVLAASHPELLDSRRDTLNLQGFFPCPRPLFANLKSDELIPKPDYQFIESQVVELNRLVSRRKSIISTIKPNGFTDATIAKEIAALQSEPDGTIKPVVNLLERLGGMDANKSIAYLPMLEKVQTIQAIGQEVENTKNTIYEVIGISDIVRGSSQASETAAAQNIKGQWANVRLNERTSDVARLWRDVFRMFAEIICEHFQPQILTLQTGIEVTPNMLAMMKSDIGRSFAIDIETDSTLAKDDYEERQQVMELIDTILARLEQVVPAVMQGALPVEFVQEALLMIVSRHKHGKQLEDSIMGLGEHWQSLQPLQQQLQQMQQQLEQQNMQLQQAGQEVQGLQQALGQVNEREEARKDAEVQMKGAETKTKMRREMVETESQMIENRIIARQENIDLQQAEADVMKTLAEVGKIRKETMQPAVAPNA